MLVLLAYGERTTTTRPVSVYSTYDTGPNGYRALYEVLRSAGVPMHRVETPLGALDPYVRTLVVTGYEADPSAKPLDDHDATMLHSYVERGGRLVAIDSIFSGKDDITPGIGVTKLGESGVARVLARNLYTNGVGVVHGSVESVLPFAQARGTPLLANQHGLVAVAYPFGRGEVIAITAPALFSNVELRDSNNLRFIYNILANHGETAFDEYVHGYDEHRGFWAALPAPVHAAFWIVVAVALLALIGANIPFAPPYLPATADERDSSAYIVALAELMRRSRERPSDDTVVWSAGVEFQHRKEHA